MKNFNHITSIALLSLVFTLTCNSCTDLGENPYDTIVSGNFLQTKDDVIRDFLRSFDHGYSSITCTYVMQENSSDELNTVNREGDWFDGGIYQRQHYHTWTPDDSHMNEAWSTLYMGIAQATISMEDIQGIDPAKFNMTEAEQLDFLAELRALRAWYHLRLFDIYRNIELITAVRGQTQGKAQATPQETFDFIENELLTAMPDLPTKETLGENALGRFTKGAAAALLVRLYLNAKVYTGEDKFAQCATVCQDLINGVYGSYGIESRWDAPFDYNNGQSQETIFGFPSSSGFAHWQYTSGMYFWSLPGNGHYYFGFTDFGGPNFKWSLQPGRDVAGNEYTTALGKPFVKFQKYPDDFRLLKYKNLGNSQREGMFLYGYLPYVNANGDLVNLQSTHSYTLYIRDAVGHFFDTPPGEVPEDLESNMNHGDQNSGIDVVKYPFYPSNDPNKLSSAYAEIRMAEIYYSLAECKYRAGDKASAAVLLNTVRARNYPAGSPSLYPASGVTLNDQEMLDEWGREFVVEGRRRTDMIRWGVFSSGTWWDKQPDADNHTQIFPLSSATLSSNPLLVQNPGY